MRKDLAKEREHALELLTRGYSVKEAAENMGLEEAHVMELLRDHDDDAEAYKKNVVVTFEWHATADEEIPSGTDILFVVRDLGAWDTLLGYRDKGSSVVYTNDGSDSYYNVRDIPYWGYKPERPGHLETARKAARKAAARRGQEKEENR